MSLYLIFFFFFKQKTAYEIRPCDWSSDVCSSDLAAGDGVRGRSLRLGRGGEFDRLRAIFAALGTAGRDLGDDCALLSVGGRTLAISIDLSLEGVHFRTDWLAFREIGWRATARSEERRVGKECTV